MSKLFGLDKNELRDLIVRRAAFNHVQTWVDESKNWPAARAIIYDERMDDLDYRRARANFEGESGVQSDCRVMAHG